MKTAKKVKDLQWNGDAAVYKLSEMVEFDGYDDDKQKTNHVVVSAVVAMDHGGPETFIFPSDKNGKTYRMLEMKGSFRGELNHAKALNGLGFKLVKQ